jgi:quinoprotein glucose dehydrogenase
LIDWLDRLIAGRAPAEISLDLIEAAARRKEPEFGARIKQFESSRRRDDPLAPYREVLSGGDLERGMTLFTSKAAVECLRCHKVPGAGGETTGGEVGPELSGIGARLSRAELLESILNPNKQIAQGFESVVLSTGDGKVHTGILRGEDANEVRLITAEGKIVVVPKDQIEERNRGPSAMPADVAAKLSKPELRDLIEYLASLKTPPSTAPAPGKVKGPGSARSFFSEVTASCRQPGPIRSPAFSPRLSWQPGFPGPTWLRQRHFSRSRPGFQGVYGSPGNRCPCR